MELNLAQVCPGDLKVQLDRGPPRVLRARRGEQHKYSVHAPMKVGVARTAGTHHLLLTVRDLIAVTPAALLPYCRHRLAARLDFLLRDLPDQSNVAGPLHTFPLATRGVTCTQIGVRVTGGSV